MTNPTSMTYDNYSFSPVPMVTIQRANLQVKNRTDPIGYTFTLSLKGTLVKDDDNPSLSDLFTQMEALRTAFNRSGKRFSISCGAEEVMYCYPRVKGINFDESGNNWVDTVPYSIELEYDRDQIDEHPDSGETPPYIEEYNEEWQCEFLNERKFFTWDLSAVTGQLGGYDYTTKDSTNAFEARITHTINIRGKQSWEDTNPTGGLTGVEVSAIDNAMSFLTGVLAVTSDSYEYAFGHALSGWTNLLGPYASGDWEPWDHFRSHSINETDGSCNFTETWMILGNNSGISGAVNKGMYEDFSIEVREGVDTSLVRVSINGSIQGMEKRTYDGFNLLRNTTGQAYTYALNAWGVIEDRIFPRAQFIYQQDHSNYLNPTPLTKSVGHNPSKGSITYSLEFDDRPCSFITGALSEVFTITDNNPADVFAKLPVIGRAAGPVLQEISTVTESTREVAIEAVMPCPTGCGGISALDQFKPTTNVKNLLCQFETALTGTYDQVFKHSDVESWSPLSGRYTRTVGWTYQSCSGTPSTSMCE